MQRSYWRMKAQKNCWTCKSKNQLRSSGILSRDTHPFPERKIGCDRGLPSCNNCLRTSRVCLGYGLRLLWPDHPDGRRRKAEPVTHIPPGGRTRPLHYGKQFLNFTFQDMALSGVDTVGIDMLATAIEAPCRGLYLHAPFLGQDAILLSYCKYTPLIRSNSHRVQAF